MRDEILFFQDREGRARAAVTPGVTCSMCGSGEVYQPLQTMDIPMTMECLNCGKTAPTKEFDWIDDP